MKNSEFILKYFDEIIEISKIIDKTEITKLSERLHKIKTNKNRVFIIGIGGSAANASHAVNDFRKILNIETYSPLDNVSELTARINDDGWDSSLVNYLKVSKFSAADSLIVFSVGGGSDNTSKNLVEAMKYAKQIGGSLFSFVSRDGGYAKKMSDICIMIPVVNDKNITPHAEEWQAILWHMLVSCVANSQFGEKNEN